MMNACTAQQDWLSVYKEAIFAPGEGTDTEGSFAGICNIAIFFDTGFASIKNRCFGGPQMGIRDLKISGEAGCSGNNRVTEKDF